MRLAATIRGAAPRLLLLALIGCGPPQPPQPPEPQSVRDQVERGPLRLTVEARPAQLDFGDTVTVSVEMRVPDGTTAQLPDVEALRTALHDDALTAAATSAPAASQPQVQDSWIILSASAAPEQQLPDGTRISHAAFVLEPTRSGDLSIPSLTVRYGEPLPGGAGRATLENEMASRPLNVFVRSLLTAQDSPLNPRDIAGVRTPAPRPADPRLWAAIILGSAAALLLVVWLIRRWARLAARPAPPVPPDVWAIQSLQALVARVYFDAGRVREYYYTVNEIVREYIERRFGVAAPEMTTEEFLRTLERRGRALPFDARPLQPFLSACDLVKYAAYAPALEDAERTAATARDFVRKTAAASAPAQPAGAAA